MARRQRSDKRVSSATRSKAAGAFVLRMRKEALHPRRVVDNICGPIRRPAGCFRYPRCSTRIASSIEFSESGIRPPWNATPVRKIFTGKWLPNSPSASAIPIHEHVAPATGDRVDLRPASTPDPASSGRPRISSMVGVRLVFRTAVVRSAEASFKIVGLDHAEQIESKNQIRIGRVDLRGRFDGMAAQKQMRNDRAALLRRTGLIQRRRRIGRRSMRRSRAER